MPEPNGTYRLRNLSFDSVVTTAVITDDQVSVTQQHDGARPSAVRYYTRAQAETLIAAWKEMTKRTPDLWAWELTEAQPT